MRTTLACATVLAILLLGPAIGRAEDIELVDGTVISGHVQRVESDQVVVRTAGDLMIFIQRKFLSLYQNYRFKEKDEGFEAGSGRSQFNLGKWCLENSAYDNRLVERAKKHLDEARSIDGGLAEEIRALIKKYGFREDPTDPGKPWVDERKWHELRGDIWDGETQKWYTKEEWEKIKTERERNVKIRYLGSTKPHAFHFATASLILGNLADYHGKQVHLWGRVLAVQFKDFPNDVLSAKHKFTAGPYVRLMLTGEDCPAVYFDLKIQGIRAKLEKFSPGDRVVVYGTVRVGMGRFALEAVDIVVK